MMAADGVLILFIFWLLPRFCLLTLLFGFIVSIFTSLLDLLRAFSVCQFWVRNVGSKAKCVNTHNQLNF